MEISSIKNKIITDPKKKLDSYKDNDSCINRKDCTISLRVNTLQYNTLHNYLLATHNVSDYTFSSISDILRHILTKIEENGIPLTKEINEKKTEYNEIVLRVTEQQKQFWSTLPHRSKRKIMEKAISAFTKDKI